MKLFLKSSPNWLEKMSNLANRILPLDPTTYFDLQMTKSERASLMEHLETRLFIKEMLFDSSDEESDAEDEDFRIYMLLQGTRYINRSIVTKTGQWTPNRVHKMDEMRAKRDLRMEKSTFFFVLSKIESHSAFFRVTNKQHKAPVRDKILFLHR